jgi:DNA-binding transcriptional MerR regulator
MLKVLPLPDDTRQWEGTAAQLASKLNELLPLVGLETDAGSANERLIRYYVSERVLSEPAPRGRERLFGFTQIVEFIVARQLLNDGWSLAKVRELIRSSSDIEDLVQMNVSARPPTDAEKALARIHSQSSLGTARDFSLGALSIHEPPAARSSWSSPLPKALERAADLTLRRTKLQADLKSLGNRSGQPERQRVLCIALTPWCQVHIDLQHLATMDSTTSRVLADALASALEEERVNTGEQK